MRSQCYLPADTGERALLNYTAIQLQITIQINRACSESDNNNRQLQIAKLKVLS